MSEMQQYRERMIKVERLPSADLIEGLVSDEASKQLANADCLICAEADELAEVSFMRHDKVPVTVILCPACMTVLSRQLSPLRKGVTS